MQQHGNCVPSLVCVKRPRIIFTEVDDNNYSMWVPPKRFRVAVRSPRTQMILARAANVFKEACACADGEHLRWFAN